MGNTKGFVGDVSRLRKMLVFIDTTASLGEITVPKIMGCIHRQDDYAETRPMSGAKNWRLTFRLNDLGSLCDISWKDYHGA
ncbi:plasmid maintenance system killer [Gluconobacter cerinus]|uniref:plasmid maintenance system killer n=1 Tax=Gluconobacter cerinus TaxID=38307 RepID=UPI00193F8E08|nr:plasmid maintenance system killer [Gluconobacter cerinus]MBM3098606.1 plasmid maintenance system killer [Gluconobacter cerinus]